MAWNRLLAGRYRDPLVGRDILVGSALIAAASSVIGIAIWVATAAGAVPLIPQFSLGPLRGGRYVVGELFSSLLVGLPFALGMMMLVLVLRTLWGRVGDARTGADGSLMEDEILFPAPSPLVPSRLLTRGCAEGPRPSPGV